MDNERVVWTTLFINLYEMEKFFKRFKLPKLTLEEIDSLSSIKEIQFSVKTFLINKMLDSSKFNQTFKGMFAKWMEEWWSQGKRGTRKEHTEKGRGSRGALTDTSWATCGCFYHWLNEQVLVGIPEPVYGWPPCTRVGVHVHKLMVSPREGWSNPILFFLQEILI